MEVDEFASRSGGVRTGFGPQASLAHYIGRIPLGDIIIMHNVFSPQGHFMTWSLKALSKVLCLSTMAQTAHFVILVHRPLATTAFGTGFRGRVLAQIGIHQSIGSTDPEKIAHSVLLGELPNAPERRQEMAKKILSTPQE